jgi:hypothetical protein
MPDHHNISIHILFGFRLRWYITTQHASSSHQRETNLGTSSMIAALEVSGPK